MQVYMRGTPSFDNLVKWEREALVHPLLDVIKEFYSKEENRQAYEIWKSKKNEISEVLKP